MARMILEPRTMRRALLIRVKRKVQMKVKGRNSQMLKREIKSNHLRVR